MYAEWVKCSTRDFIIYEFSIPRISSLQPHEKQRGRRQQKVKNDLLFSFFEAAGGVCIVCSELLLLFFLLQQSWESKTSSPACLGSSKGRSSCLTALFVCRVKDAARDHRGSDKTPHRHHHGRHNEAWVSVTTTFMYLSLRIFSFSNVPVISFNFTYSDIHVIIHNFSYQDTFRRRRRWLVFCTHCVTLMIIFSPRFRGRREACKAQREKETFRILANFSWSNYHLWN